MKPQPMSESEIVKCLVDAGCIGTVKMTFESGPYDITRTSINADRFARAIIAARDAQWAAMIGEPVAWGHEAFVGGSWVLQWPVRCSQSSAKEDCAMYGKAETLRVLPLYAIKETP